MKYEVVGTIGKSIFEVGQDITNQVNYLIQNGYIPYGNLVVFENSNKINAMQAMVRYDEGDTAGVVQWCGERGE